MSSCTALSINPLTHLKIGPTFAAIRSRNRKSSYPSVRSDNSQQQLNLSVLRFTFGIPGLDESYLPRWIGYGFGSLLLLNHFIGSDSALTPAQLRTEALGLSLSALSISLPYFGRFLKGATPLETASLPQGAQQVFLMPEDSSKNEDLAWASYVLLRNTNTVAVLISVEDELCVRGYWNTPDNLLKSQLLDWFKRQIEGTGLSSLKDTLYFPQAQESELWEMLPKGTCSVLVEPLLPITEEIDNEMKIPRGFVLVSSSIAYAYTDKDKAWIRAILNKFRGR